MAQKRRSKKHKLPAVNIINSNTTLIVYTLYNLCRQNGGTIGNIADNKLSNKKCHVARGFKKGKWQKMTTQHGHDAHYCLKG